MTDIIAQKISSFITEQFPQFIKEDDRTYQGLIDFMITYYDWMESEGNITDKARQFLEDIDVDTASDVFLTFMRNEFMATIPVNVKSDPRFLIKNIASFFRTKGTEESYRILFAILFNQVPDFYYPGKDILRVSDGKWIREQYAEVDVSSGDIFKSTINQIGGRTSGAHMRFERYSEYYLNNTLKRYIYVSDVRGTFVQGETLYDIATDTDLARLSSNGILMEAGKWKNTDSFLSSDKYFQDNFYYQEYSYVIKSPLTLSQYENLVKPVIHPAGTKLFGQFEDQFQLDTISVNLDVNFVMGYSDNSSFPFVYDYEITIEKISTGYDQTILNSGNVVIPNLPGTLSTTSNSTVGAWTTFTPADLDNIPITSFGSRDFFVGTGTTFLSDLDIGDNMYLIDNQNAINTFHNVSYIYTNRFMKLGDVYTYDTTGANYKLQADAGAFIVFDGGFEQETYALVDRLSVLPSTKDINRIDATIKDLKAADIWNNMDAVYIPGLLTNSTDAKLNWKENRYNLTQINSIPFTNYKGFDGNGSGYFKTGFYPANAVHWTQDNAHMSIFRRQSVGNFDMGDIDAAGQHGDYITYSTGSLIEGGIINAGATTSANSNSSLGLVALERVDHINAVLYKNGTQLVSRLNGNYRDKDNMTIPLANGTYDFTFTFSDNTTQNITSVIVNSGNWTIPTNLNKPVIKTLTGNLTGYGSNPYVNMNFATGTYSTAGTSRTLSYFPFTRATGAYAATSNVSAGFTSFANNAPRVTNIGLTYEKSSINYIPNSTIQASVPGTPGTMPTGFTSWPATWNGLSRQVVGNGSTGGVTYVDIRYSGTATIVDRLNLTICNDLNVPITLTDTITSSVYCKLIAGSLNGISLELFIDGTLPNGNTHSDYNRATLNTGGASLFDCKTTVTWSPTKSDTVATISFIGLTVNTGTAIDFTIRVAQNQLEKSSVATSMIPTMTDITYPSNNVEMYMLALNYNGVYGTSATKMSAAFLGKSLGPTKNAQLYNIINTRLGEVGANVP